MQGSGNTKHNQQGKGLAWLALKQGVKLNTLLTCLPVCHSTALH